MGTGSRKLPREPVPGWGLARAQVPVPAGTGTPSCVILSPPGQAPRHAPSWRDAAPRPRPAPSLPGAPARGRSAPCGSGSGP
ncbi:hypothetical protein L535_4423 [Bordetella bronchiseptica SBL-F6116]|nr:hypothetical protein L535_4423 [Bordetella bronchiseptica SBL-F6116]